MPFFPGSRSFKKTVDMYTILFVTETPYMLLRNYFHAFQPRKSVKKPLPHWKMCSVLATSSPNSLKRLSRQSISDLADFISWFVKFHLPGSLFSTKKWRLFLRRKGPVRLDNLKRYFDDLLMSPSSNLEKVASKSHRIIARNQSNRRRSFSFPKSFYPFKTISWEIPLNYAFTTSLLSYTHS